MITGDRNWNDVTTLTTFFTSTLTKKYPPTAYAVIHGGCRGVDSIAANVAGDIGYKTCEFPADWSSNGKAAGPIRNKEMIDLLPEVVVIFHTTLSTSTGTKDCVKQVCKRMDRSFTPALYLNGSRVSRATKYHKLSSCTRSDTSRYISTYKQLHIARYTANTQASTHQF